MDNTGIGIASSVAFIGEMADMRGKSRHRNLCLARYTSRKHPLREWQLNLQFEPRDLWVGVFWRVHRIERLRFLHVYLCVVPTLPLHLAVMRLQPPASPTLPTPPIGQGTAG